MKLRAFATATALTALFLAACGTTEEPAGTAAPASSAPSGPVDPTDERGTVHLDAPAKNVVSLEWGLTENLVALGVKPVGQADVKGYNVWDSVFPIDASTPDVGRRGEASLDSIVALDPDRVVTTTDLQETVIAQLAKKVPVLALRGSDGSDPIAVAAVLTAAAACAVGALPFVGLVAPHAARALVGGKHARSVPVAVGLGAVLVSVADTVGRTVLAPTQLAAGLVTALIGAPYFVWLLWRSRTA
ncbi:iron chelate uptake ABC transporter family permease subunit [Actinoplanes sp. NPDC051513]|uniref:iron chelate uptake ABC transporter family permease subunit n=1 Tax=Actinoplanes sp. NPDC051513 TaxID=3363908 RepID=UPI0037A5563A